jgi:hypothetical protein
VHGDSKTRDHCAHIDHAASGIVPLLAQSGWRTSQVERRKNLTSAANPCTAGGKAVRNQTTPPSEHNTQMKQIPKPCTDCGTPTPNTRCQPCMHRWYLEHPKPKRKHYAGDYQTRRKKMLKTATHCYLCGQPPTPNDPLTADHVFAGVPDSPLLPAHRSCNSRKGNRDPHTASIGDGHEPNTRSGA